MSYTDFRIPGVYARILDATQFQAEAVPMVLGMTGLATKGPFNTPTKAVSISDWFNKFGPPDPDLQGYYAADSFFSRGNEGWFIRVGDGAQAKAYLDLAITGGGSAPRIRAKSEGTWGHDIDVYVTLGSAGAGYIKIEIYYLGALVDSWDDVAEATDTDLATLMAGSLYIEAVNGTAGGTVDEPQSGTLASGDNGDSGIAAANFIGTIVGNTRTGLEIFRNQREYPIDLLICPDAAAEHTVSEKLLSLAEYRGDCFSLIDTPDSLTPAGAVSWIDSATKFDSSWGSGYYPWAQIWDDKNQQNVWTPPSGHVAGAMAYNDDIAWPWFACAGVKRGRLIKALDLRLPLSDLDIETLYADSRVNSIIKRNTGIMINGHKTLLDAATALRYNEVRRALIALRFLATGASRTVQFDPNDSYTFRAMEGAMAPVVEFLVRERAFRELAFECSEKLNKPSTKRQHIIKSRFYCKPTIAAEIIILDIILTAEGLAFSEQTVQPTI